MQGDQGLVIKRANRHNADIVAVIHNICFAKEITHLSKYGYREVDPEEVVGWLSQGQVLLAEIGGVAVGYIHFSVCKDLDEKYGVAVENNPQWLGQSKLGVLPDQRRKGIATRLIHHAIETSCAENCVDFRVTVYSDNTPCRLLLDKLGFERMGLEVILAERDLTDPMPQHTPPTGVTIEMATDKDIDMYAAFFAKIREDYGSYTDPKTYVRGVLSDDESAGVLFAKCFGEVVGCIQADKVADCGFIGLPGVLPEYRRRGIGTALMIHMLTLLRDKGLTLAITDSDTSRQLALNLYWKTGFAEARRRLTYKHTCHP